MATSPHEGLFRRPSREKIVAAVGGGIPKSQAARAFGVSLSSVKRYVKKADRGEPPAPRKSPGSAPKPDEKATKLLEADLKQRGLLPPSEKSAATTYTPSSRGSR
jgi:transposase